MRELTYRYRIYPTRDQEKAIAGICGCARYIYNELLTVITNHYREHGEWMEIDAGPYMALSFIKRADYSAMWCAVESLQYGLERFIKMDLSRKLPYRPESQLKAIEDPGYQLLPTDREGYPRLKRKKTARQTYTTKRITLKGTPGRVEIPNVGSVRIKVHRPLPEGAEILSATVMKKSSGSYFILFKVSIPETVEQKEYEKPLGVAYSSGRLAVRSDGEKVLFREQDEELTKKIRKAYRDLKRKHPGSSRYEKQKKYLASLYEYRYNVRRDELHKAARQITNAADLIYMQTPDVMYRLRQMKGKQKRARQLDESWWTFSQMIEYKAAADGSYVHKIPRQFPVERLCSRCDRKNKKSNTRFYGCRYCNLQLDRDKNTARNLEKLAVSYLESLRD